MGIQKQGANPAVSAVGGFTLIEVMIVIVIISILSAIAYPSYTAQTQKVRRSDGQVMLMEIMAAQERFYSQNNVYTTDLTDMGFDAAQASEKGFYTTSAAACSGLPLTACVNLTATVVSSGAQQGTSNLTMDSRNNKTPAEYWD